MRSKSAQQRFSGLHKAEQLLKAGQLAAAEQLLRQFSRQYPESEQAWLLLASLYGQRGRFQEVIDCCQKIITLNQRQPAARSLLGAAYAALGRYPQAIEQLTIALELDRKNTGILNNLGNVLYAEGKFDEAADRFSSALGLNPGHPQSHFGLGNCCLAQGLWNKALQNYQKAYQAMPNNYDINMSLGMAYRNLGKLDEAIHSYQRALELTNQPEAALCELARVTQLKGDLEEALNYIEQSLGHQPTNVDTLALGAEIYYKIGRIEEAHSQIRRLLDQGNITPAIINTYALMCNQFNDCNEVIHLAGQLIENDVLDQSSLTGMHFTLGRLYDQSGDYDAAFSHYQRGNAILPGRFSRNECERDISRLISGYNKESINTLPRSHCLDERPVFIVGMPRSGTSLVEQILACHPAVLGTGERNDFNEFAAQLSRKSKYDYADKLPSISQEKLDEMASHYLCKAGKLADEVARITDKMPANYYNLGLVMQLFPRAHVIHCRRDPRDTCLSIYFQQFSKGHAYANNLADIACLYRQHERLMAHWRKVLDIPILEINYADLVKNSTDCITGMLQFLGLPLDERCLHHHKSNRAVATASFDQVRQPVHTRSINRWKHYSSHLAELITEFGDQDAALEWTDSCS
ncbi:MAG: sulfotransferase [Gammaproteobacteria bacterium]